ncbi:MAG: hypothetical protein ABIT68_10785 [Sphingomicrobium sp.]
MEWGIGVDRAEQAMDGAAAAMFAAAVGFGLWAVESGIGIAMAAAAATFLAAKLGLGLIVPETRTYPMPAISPVAIDTITEAPGGADDELTLEDKLVEVSPDARVIRLFGPSQSHHSGHPGQAPPDASQALSEALAELRRSLR